MSQRPSTVHKWTDYEIEKLIGLIERGLSFGELVAGLGCSERELECEALYLGVLLPEHEAVQISTHTTNSSVTHVSEGVLHFAPAKTSSRASAG